MTGIELKTDSWHRWMMYSKEAYGSGRIFLTTEQRQAVEEGKKFAQRAYADVSARDVELVKRVRSFLGANFHWHGRLAKSGADLEVIQTLQSMIRGESVVLVAEKPRSGGAGNTGLLAPTGSASAFVPYDDDETREQMRAFARRILYPPGEPVLSGPYDPATQQAKLSAARAAMSGGSSDNDSRSLLGVVEAAVGTVPGSDDADGSNFADDADTSTSLGDAQPFEYTPDAVSGDAEELAARGVSEAEEAECDAMYEMRMTYCRGLSSMYGGDPRTYAACSEQAFRNYQTCRGY